MSSGIRELRGHSIGRRLGAAMCAVVVAGTWLTPDGANGQTGAPHSSQRTGRPTAARGSTSALVESSDSAEQVRRELDDILAQPAFRRLRRQTAETPAGEDEDVDSDWLKGPLRWLWKWLTKGAEGLSALGAVWQALAYTALAVVCCLIIWLVVRAVSSYRQAQADRVTRTLRPEEGEASLPPGDVSADEYERRAEELAAQGRFREAVGQLILGGMSRTERARLIRFRRGLTHRDYLRALRLRPGAQQSFRAMVSIYEPICFGRRPAHDDHYDAARRAYQDGFRDPGGLQTAAP